MIIAHSEETRYLARFSNGIHTAQVDATLENGGHNAAFRPHDLLEAALASSLNLWLRIQADKRGYPLEAVSTQVVVDRDDAEQTTFRYVVELLGAELTAEQRQDLLSIVTQTPVKNTLSKPIQFVRQDAL